MADPLVSVIIVNYNGRRYLPDCLGSLERQRLPRGEYEVIVVDNDSTDGSVEWVKEAYPAVKVIALKENVGFARGNNLGLRPARGEYIALLNNDAVAEPNWLHEAVATLEVSPKLGGVASKIRFHDDPRVLNSTGLVLYRDGRGGDRGFREEDRGQFEQEDEVFGPCGAAMVVRRELLDDLGGFDERLFLYYEDLDLAWRARLRGWSFHYCPKAVVQHVHCGSAGEWSPRFCFYVERNRALVNCKNAPPSMALKTSVGLFLRVLRAWWRVASGWNQRALRAAHGMAYAQAAASFLLLLPSCLWNRRRIRGEQRRVSDHELARFF
ncbi:MAG TPA: glycosyltransferase family 2 protein, partial [Gemmataceae bacterium]|nr:glycosyltransferase family 2 protein [Gemmataceae bacterium]